jgi:catechol 2,3-dioxygenase-like lactoylglutathione lyase family enzyme
VAYRIHNLHFKSPDPDRTAQWWADNLGAKITRKREVEGTVGIRLDLDGVPLNITGFVQGQKLEQFAGLEHIGLFTDDLQESLEQLKAAGAKVLEELPSSMGPCAFLEGPDGVRIEITENKG